MYFHIWKYKNYTEGTFQEVEKHRKKPLRGHLKLKEGIIQQEQKTEVLYTNNTEVSQGHWLVNNTFCKAFNDISLHCTKSHYDWKKLQAVPNLSVQSWVNTAFSPGCLGHSQLGVQSWQGRKIPIWAPFKHPAVLTGKTFSLYSVQTLMFHIWPPPVVTLLCAAVRSSPPLFSITSSQVLWGC